MADKTGISWTSATWNPTTGCDKVSPGCGLPRFDGDDTGGCYAMAMAARLKKMGQAKYQADGDPRTSGPGFGLTLHPGALTIPLRWRKPRRVFVDSMSDLGHARVPRDFLARVWAVMAITPEHIYQVLSKRPERIRRILSDGVLGTEGFPDMVEEAIAEFSHAALDEWPLRNVHVGTSIELDRYCRRADYLRGTPAALRFLSLEPLLGPLPSLNLDGIGWCIIGGESGPGHRPMDLAWLESIVTQCLALGVPLWIKQDSGPRSGMQGRIPDDLWSLKQFPGEAVADA